MEHHCFSRLSSPCSSSHLLDRALLTKLFRLIRQWPFLARLALWTSSFPIPNRRSLRRRVRTEWSERDWRETTARRVGAGATINPSPLFPVVKSHAAAQPLIEGSNVAKRDTNHVVVHRSAKVSTEVGDDFHGRVTSRSFGQSPDFGLELLLAFLGPSDFPTDDRKTEEGRFTEGGDFAFGLIRFAHPSGYPPVVYPALRWYSLTTSLRVFFR